MNSKWYISTLFLVLFIVFGAFQEQTTIANQEIVLEFIDTKINKKEINNTIADVKEKLLSVGVTNIKVHQLENGALKISYYSVVEVDNIKDALSKAKHLFVNLDSEKKDKDLPSSIYNIDIYELTNEKELTNLGDQYILEFKYFSDRFNTNNPNALLAKADHFKANQLFKTAFKINKNNPFIEDKSSYKKPEVRAGPLNINSYS